MYFHRGPLAIVILTYCFAGNLKRNILILPFLLYQRNFPSSITWLLKLFCTVHPGKSGEVLNFVPLCKRKKLLSTSAHGAWLELLFFSGSLWTHGLKHSMCLSARVVFSYWYTHCIIPHFTGGNLFQLAPVLLIFSPRGFLSLPALWFDKRF